MIFEKILCVSRVESAFAGFVGFAGLAMLARQTTDSTRKMTLSILDTQIVIPARIMSSKFEVTFLSPSPSK